MRNRQIERKIVRKQFIVAWIIAALLITGMMLTANRFFHHRNRPSRGVTITVHSGYEFMVGLDSNATTGYQWQLAQSPDGKIIKFLKSVYITPNTNLTGAPGMERWTFMALSPGRSKISLKYVRPWERDSPPADRKEFNIVVK